jgi:hypothetical protein
VAVENHSQSRLFTFGCSFTKFKWPTWADIIGREFSEHQNWGKQGGGNCFILWSLMEAIHRNKINSQDTVAIMWSSVGREDRWVDGNWITPGSIYRENQYNPYSADFIKNLADPNGYLIRDMANIAAAKAVLDSLGCKHYMTSMMPFEITSDSHQSLFDGLSNKILSLLPKNFLKTVRDEFPSDSDEIMKVYQNVLEHVRPSMYEVIFERDWFRYGATHDFHPNPLLHLEYVEKVLPEFPISEETRNWTKDMHNRAERGLPYTSTSITRF